MKTKAAKPILIVPADFSPEKIKEVSSAGYLAIPTDNPDSIRLILPGAVRSGDDLMMSAMHALGDASYGGDDVRSCMVKELVRRMKEREK